MDQIETFLTSRPYSPNTITTYRKALTDFLTDHPRPAKLKPADLLTWLNRPEWGNSHRRVKLNAIKQFLGWRYGQTHPALSAKIKTRRGKVPRSLSRDQALALLSSFDPSTPKGARDLAISCLAIDTGLRLAELCRLKLADTDLQTCSLQVIVKGGDVGRGRFSRETANIIETWKAQRRSQADTLFTNSRSGKPLTREGLQSIVKAWGKKLGIKLSPHDLRRTFATLSTLNGAPNRIVQIAGRWKTPDMVTLYTRSIEQDAIEKYLPVANL